MCSEDWVSLKRGAMQRETAHTVPPRNGLLSPSTKKLKRRGGGGIVSPVWGWFHNHDHGARCVQWWVLGCWSRTADPWH